MDLGHVAADEAARGEFRSFAFEALFHPPFGYDPQHSYGDHRISITFEAEEH